MVLAGQQIRVHGAAVVQHLALHAHVGGVALERGADADAVVAVGEQLELEAEHEIAVLFLREQIAAAIRGTVQYAVLRHIPRP